MIKWISRDKELPKKRQWVFVYDGKNAYAALWVENHVKVLPTHRETVTGYFKDMVLGAYAQGITHWAPLPMDPNENFNVPEMDAVKRDIEVYLTKLSLKHRGFSFVCDNKDNSFKIVSSEDEHDEDDE